MRVVLVRHPAPDIAAGICYGRLNVALTQAAKHGLERQAADPVLQGATRVWTSPAVRCRDLGCLIARRLAVDLIIDERLLELDFGVWEGRDWDDVPRAALDRWAAAPAEFAPPGGESSAALVRRVNRFFSDLCDNGRDCVVVSHGGPLKILAAMLASRPVDLLAAPPPVGSLVVVEWRG